MAGAALRMAVLTDAPCCVVCGSVDTTRWRTPTDVAIWRCRRCGARVTSPAPSRVHLRERYEEEHRSGKWKRLMEHADGGEIERRARVITRLAPRSSRGTLLDVGFGDGRFLDAAGRLGWKTMGTEIALSAASQAARRHPRIVGDLETLREGPIFDVITFFDVLEHLRDPGHVVRQAGARLREHGLIVITMPNVRGTASLLSASRWPYYDFGAYGHIHHLSPRHVRELVRRAGFETVYEETRGSVDLRDLPAMYGWNAPSKIGAWVCDKASGALARLAQPLGFGNTLFTVARKVPGGSGRTLGGLAGSRNGARG